MGNWDYWLILGFIGQFIFGMRFIVQWICSERRKESYIPLGFWYLSLCGGVMLLVYAIYRRDPVFIVGQGSGLLVYIRNLMLIRKQRPGEEDLVTVKGHAQQEA